jgi:predicted nucleic acid-binding Zn ribbon protein
MSEKSPEKLPDAGARFPSPSRNRPRPSPQPTPEPEGLVSEGVARQIQGKSGPLSGALRQSIRQMENTLQGHEESGRLSQNLAALYWDRVVGTQAAAATEADAVRDGILFVNTKNSVWSHELTLYKTRILADLNQIMGEARIMDIKFRVRTLRKQAQPAEEPPDTPSLDELRAVVLEPAEREELRLRLEGLFDIAEENVREKIARRLNYDARLRHWRITRGWRVCIRCSAAHKTDNALCPICRLCG